MYQLSIDYYLEETREIPLSQGKVAIVCACDYDWLMQWKWHLDGAGYAQCRTQGLMHRLIIQAPAAKQVDHINANRLDNRRSNLRLCTAQQNTQNKLKSRFSRSKYKGVQPAKYGSRWKAFIAINKVYTYLGTFDTELDAALAYDAAAREHFGEFARLNFPTE